MKRFAVLTAVLIAVVAVLTAFAGCSKLPQQEQGGAQGESQTEAEGIDVTEYFAAAEFLAEKIVVRMPKENFESGEVNAAVANEAVFTMAVSAFGDKADTRSPYPGLITGEDNRGCHFSKKACEEAVYEIFGFENYNFELGYGAEYDEEAGEYVLDIGFGSGYYILPEEIWAEESGAGGITVNFIASEVRNVGGDPVWVPFGEYQMQFEVLTENEKTFLRYVGISGFRYPGVDDSQTKLSAEYLTEEIIKSFWSENFGKFSDEVYTRFLYFIAISSAIENYDNRTPYREAFYIDESEKLHLPLAECERVIFEVFGKTLDEFKLKFPKEYYSEDSKEYVIADYSGFDLTFGKGQGLWFDGISTVYSEETKIETETEILKPAEGGWQTVGTYRFAFDIVQTESASYLRFAGIEEVLE